MTMEKGAWAKRRARGACRRGRQGAEGAGVCLWWSVVAIVDPKKEEQDVVMHNTATEREAVDFAAGLHPDTPTMPRVVVTRHEIVAAFDPPATSSESGDSETEKETRS